METTAQIKKHPIHPMLIPLPIGLWVFSLVSDIIFKAGWGGPVWNSVAFYTMAGGIVGALLAALPGLVDFTTLQNQRTKWIALLHMILNLTAVVLFAFNLWLRTRSAPGAAAPIVLSVIGILVLVVSGWLGGELVYVRGVAVAPAPEPRD